jgi:hypothetical protein
MNTWLNKFCPGFMTLPRKPHPFGNEYHSITEGNGRKLITWRIKIVKGKDRLKKANGTWAFPSKYERTWLAMSANVSVGYTPQTTDIFVCRRHVGNVVPTRRRHSVMSAIFLAVGVVWVRPVADTHSYMNVGISTDEVVTTYEDKKNWHPLRFSIHSQVLTLCKSK